MEMTTCGQEGLGWSYWGQYICKSLQLLTWYRALLAWPTSWLIQNLQFSRWTQRLVRCCWTLHLDVCSGAASWSFFFLPWSSWGLHCRRISKTSFIVGLVDGNVVVHMRPRLKRVVTYALSHCSLISSSTTSSMVFPSLNWFHAHSTRHMCSLLGSLLVTSSSRTTPKLYTSILSFTFVV